MPPNKRHILIPVVLCIIFAVFITMATFLYWYFLKDTHNKHDCFIHINKDTTPQHPLILNNNTNQIYLPNHINGLFLKQNQRIILSCPGHNNYIKPLKQNITEIDAICIHNKTFQINGSNYNFKQIQCAYYPEFTAKRSNYNCSQVYQHINVGFVTKRAFITLYSTCFNPKTMDSLYSYYNLTPSIKTYQYTKRPRYFKAFDFYAINPSILYTRKHQQLRFKYILGVDNLISLSSDYFLARGHLTAKADFVYGAQQRATFAYINVAPQWQTFNGKNWMELENSVRNYVSQKAHGICVYTGVYGNAQLLNINGIRVNLTLHYNQTDILNVPDIFWKILFDPVTLNGVVLIGHNNPYENVSKQYCIDICDKINWNITWDRFNLISGYSYCCDYHQFKTIVHYAPELPINGLLIN